MDVESTLLLGQPLFVPFIFATSCMSDVPDSVLPLMY
jgi:hypothetical protein